jgi:probable phosphoglycerate mutase
VQILAEFGIPAAALPEHPTVDALAELITTHVAEGGGEEEVAGQTQPAAAAMAAAATAAPTPLPTHATAWNPTTAALVVVLNATVDTATVPSGPSGTREDQGHVVVLDNLFGEEERLPLLQLLNGAPGYDDGMGPPTDRWERATCDGEGDAPTWGLKDHVMEELVEAPIHALVEVQSRLQLLFPEYAISRLPQQGVGQQQHQAVAPTPSSSTTTNTSSSSNSGHVANPMVANAAVHGDAFQWHIDADPSLLPEYNYLNREPGKPYWVTLLLYLNDGWPKHWDAETLFLDLPSDTGFFVRPGKYRAVLMDQDVTHRVSAPSQRANGKPRYSLVWKLLFIPRAPDAPCTIARPEWGTPLHFGPKTPSFSYGVR